MSNPLNKLRVEDNLDKQDMARLRANRYAEMCSQWNKVYLIRNTKYPDKVAELRALSLIHACNLIGWRSRQVELISVVEIDEKE